MEKYNSEICSICKQHSISLLYVKDDYSIFRCNSCNVQLRLPQPSHEELKKIYANYYHPWKIENEVAETVKISKTKTFEIRLQEIQKHIRRGKILDVGCAAGYFLESAKNAGFEPYGVELSESFFKETHLKFGDSIYRGTIENIPCKDNFFDVITMFDLLEHVKDPVSTLRRCRKILMPNGVIAAVLPNTSSLTAKLMRKNWMQYKKEHLFYFSPKNISALLKQESFDIIKIVPAIKVISLKILYYHQFKYHPHHPITVILSLLLKTLPRAIQKMPIYISLGEMFVLARKI